MDPIELSYDAMTSVPEAYRGLYSEKDGKAVLTHVNGIKTNQDVLNVQEALRKERSDHSTAKDLLKNFSALGKPADELQGILDRLPELETAAKGGIDETKIESLLSQRLIQKTAPLERKLTEASEALTRITAERDQAVSAISRRDMSDTVRAVATEMKVLGTAVADVELFAQIALERQEDGTYVTRTGIQGVTAGVDVKTMLKDMQKIRPHWWPASEGGGAGGGQGRDGDNPWTSANWSVTNQGKYITAHGLAAAQAAAKSAGSSVGATSPTITKK